MAERRNVSRRGSGDAEGTFRKAEINSWKEKLDRNLQDKAPGKRAEPERDLTRIYRMEQGAGKVRDNQTTEKKKFGIDAQDEQDRRPETEKLLEIRSREAVKTRSFGKTTKKSIPRIKRIALMYRMYRMAERRNVSHGGAEMQIIQSEFSGKPAISSISPMLYLIIVNRQFSIVNCILGEHNYEKNSSVRK